MALLLAVGFMQVAGMALIAVALLIERRFVRRWVSVVLGVAAVGYGVAVAVHPALAPGLVMGPMGGM